jgi:hypothetical protein
VSLLSLKLPSSRRFKKPSKKVIMLPAESNEMTGWHGGGGTSSSGGSGPSGTTIMAHAGMGGKRHGQSGRVVWCPDLSVVEVDEYVLKPSMDSVLVVKAPVSSVMEGLTTTPPPGVLVVVVREELLELLPPLPDRELLLCELPAPSDWLLLLLGFPDLLLLGLPPPPPA